MSVSVVDAELTFTSSEDYNGIASVTVTVSDGFLTDSETFTLTITPVNDAPILSAIGSQIMIEDTPLILTLSSTDIDEDAVTYSAVSSSPQDVSLSIDDTELTLTPSLNYNGSVDISVTVSDGFLSDNDILLPLENFP